MNDDLIKQLQATLAMQQSLQPATPPTIADVVAVPMGDPVLPLEVTQPVRKKKAPPRPPTPSANQAPDAAHPALPQDTRLEVVVACITAQRSVDDTRAFLALLE